MVLFVFSNVHFHKVNIDFFVWEDIIRCVSFCGTPRASSPTRYRAFFLSFYACCTPVLLIRQQSRHLPRWGRLIVIPSLSRNLTSGQPMVAPTSINRRLYGITVYRVWNPRKRYGITHLCVYGIYVSHAPKVHITCHRHISRLACKVISRASCTYHVLWTIIFSPFFGFPLRGSSCVAGDEVSMCFKNRLEGKAFL